MAVVAIMVGNAVSDVSFPAWIGPAGGTVKFRVLAGIALLLLRVEGVRPGEIGLSRRLLGPALLAGFGLWAALNVVAAGLAVALGNQWGFGLILEMPARWPDVPFTLFTSLAFDFLVVALVEEFVFRGYLQTKVIALLGDDSRARIGLGILAASVVFGALHTPAMIVQGASPSGIVGTAAFLGLSGLGVGILYELTHNVYFVALLHAVGNTWPLVADVWTWSGTAVVAALVAVLVVYFGVTFAYRSWALDTDLTPVVERSEASQPARSDGVDPSGV
ncbi:CPBP family intramembrane glutamic endopeptidase [Halosimplex halobium]|uniref:CPBP family intramembrane glutamic endopeptidase n=1 Tax=Halosimplex halobium TaxID=3396618 RepID=UPI003F5775B5